MATSKVKNIKKAEWQEIAKSYNIPFTEKNEVRYLVEKIAEQVGVNDDIVKLDDLKQAVYDKINPSANVQETAPVVTETVATPVSKLDELRAECKSYGLAYADFHTETDLEQLLSHIRGKVAPVSEEPVTQAPAEEFELKADNFEEVVAQAPTQLASSQLPNVMEGINPYIPVVLSSNAQLEQYKTLFTQTIRSHFRLLTTHEISDMINRDTYPFTFEIRHNPNQRNQIEIFFTSGGSTVRLPSSDTNDWISING